MINEITQNAYVGILKEELMSAMGCTEPIAIAYAAAILSDALGEMPKSVKAGFSGNIIKNVKSVIVPMTGGKHGIEAAIAAVFVLFVPMLMDTGGNSGSQASVTVIRGISLGEVRHRDALRVIAKELTVGALCGLSLGLVAFGKVMLVDRLLMNNPEVSITVALIVAATLAITVIIAKLIGATLPMLASKIGLDPAVMASPFITTIVDALSLIIYFFIASSILPL